MVSELTRLFVNVESIFLDFIQERPKPLKLLLESDLKHHHVVLEHKVGVKLESNEYGVHHPLERSGCRAKPKWHWLQVLEAIQCEEAHLFSAQTTHFDF